MARPTSRATDRSRPGSCAHRHLATDDDKKKTFIAVAGKMHYSSKECVSPFLCDPFHRKHLLHQKKPIAIPHVHKKPIAIPHPQFHKKPDTHPSPLPEHKPPMPVQEYKAPTPEYSHPLPTPIYHPPADQTTQNPETDPEKFKKLLPFIKKKPFFPKFKKFPPIKEDIKA
jgi:hypothetical protein